MRARIVTLLVAALALPLTMVALPAGSAQAAVPVGARSAVLDPAIGGFPTWYQDQAGTRLEPCLDPNDANCILPPDVIAPYAFPANFPDEFFYGMTESQIFTTTGCGGVPGRVSVRMALEGAFINGAPAQGDQMTFGRTRITGTGLCPDTDYTFDYPFGTKTLRTNNLGTIIRGAGTVDVGCVPTPTLPCDFDAARASEVMGGPAGFLKWDPAESAPPAGYLGDALTLHTIVGGTQRNTFTARDSSGTVLADVNGTPMTTTKFTVMGKLAGPLSASPSAPDFAGVELGATKSTTVTLTNLDATPLTVAAPVVTGTGFAVTGTTCAAPLARDASCTVTASFSPPAAGPTGISTGTLTVPHDRYRSPSLIPLTGTAVNRGAQATGVATPDPLAFGQQRVRVLSAPKLVTVTNTGSAPLVVSTVALTNSGTGSGAEQFSIGSNTCTLASTPPGGTCQIGVRFLPETVGDKSAALELTSNSVPPVKVAVSGTGIGGHAAVAGTIDRGTGFPDWYMDESGLKVSECLDPKDPYCIVLPDATYDGQSPLSFLDRNDPTGDTLAAPGLNFPSEFFYTVAENAPFAVEGCSGPGSVLIRTAMEGAFANGDPVRHEQMTFARIRVTAKNLCPSSTYQFIHPYGAVTLQTSPKGIILRNVGTEDVGCAPVAPDVCDFRLALQARPLGGFLRWDPAVAPSAPAGYLGDAKTGHPVIGAPFTYEGQAANFVKVVKLPGQDDAPGTLPRLIGETDQFVVMGKLKGPLEATVPQVDFDLQPVGVTSNPQQVTLENTGINPITLSGASVTGADATDVALAGGGCLAFPVTLAPGAQCSLSATFRPSAVGSRHAAISVRHDGFNDPFELPVTGTGQAGAATPAISFTPRTLSFAPLKVGGTSAKATLTVSNAGGLAPLDIAGLTFAGPAADQFAVAANGCTSPVGPGATCPVDVVFTPTTVGAKSADLVVHDNVNGPGSTHTVALSAEATNTAPAVAAQLDPNGYPQWYQDDNGTRLEPCTQQADPGCVLLPDAFYNATRPLAFPSNFPAEFFYNLADSEQIVTPGCPAAGIAPGTGFLRVGLEGSFANGVPSASDQITFTRTRIVVRGGLCPGGQYSFVTPYGQKTIQADATGSILAKAGTIDTGCGAAPCAFGSALTTPDAAGSATVAAGYLRWDPNVGPAAPAGHLGDGTSFHKVVGGTFVAPGLQTPANAFEIRDTAGNLLVRTDRFLVSGRVAGPLVTPTTRLAFPDTAVNTVSAAQTLTLTNVGAAGTSVTGTTLTGLDAAQFAVSASTCGAAMAQDSRCTVSVRFVPTATGTRTATLRLVASTGQVVTVALSGVSAPQPVPVIAVSTGALAFGTTTPSAPVVRFTNVTNTGTAPLTITAEAVSGAAAADYTVNTVTPNGAVANCRGLPVVVNPGSTCAVAVSFTPTAVGARAATLTLRHNDVRPGVAGQTLVSLSATGTGSSFSVAAAAFGVVRINTAKTLTVTIKNTGTTAAVLTGFTLNGNPASTSTVTGVQRGFFTIAGAGCLGTTLARGKSCNVSVTFRPTTAVSYRATLSVKGNANSLPGIVTSSLTGTGK